jgi:hypothetical protein
MANSVLKIKPSDDIWNDDFLSQHIGKRVVLRLRYGGIIDDYLHENGAGSLKVGDWCVSQNGDPFSFFKSLEIHKDGGCCIKQIIADEAAEYFKTQSDLNNLSIKEKTMNVIKNAFKSKEDKALEYYNFGRVDNLNDNGLEEFLSFLWETADKDTKKAFLKLIVDRYKEDNRCK